MLFENIYAISINVLQKYKKTSTFEILYMYKQKMIAVFLTDRFLSNELLKIMVYRS